MSLSRRVLMAGGAALPLSISSAAHRPAQASTQLAVIRATSRTLDIDGRAATVLGLLRPDGGHGLVQQPGERFRVRLENRLPERTIIHWHGQTPPFAQDGVPDTPLPLIAAGADRAFDFVPNAGTHWMHAHVPDQEMRLLAAPHIVRSAEDARADRQEVVMMLHDYSFTPLGEILARLGAGGGAPHAAAGNPHGGMSPYAAPHGGMPMGAADINDIDFDAYLANDRTLGDPEVVRVERGGRVLLRVINGAAATVFWIDTGRLEASVVAVDGHPVDPLRTTRFALAMGQRADLLLELPGEGGTFPILALREGARERTGIILATPNAPVARIAPEAESAAHGFDGRQELRLHSTSPVPARRADRNLAVTLNGGMTPYVWSIDDRPWGRHRVLEARRGERVELTMTNVSMMAHPMHIHGTVFQVVGWGSQRFVGARRDTVQVPPMERVTLAFEFATPGRWMFHCHHMPHLATGMMTEFVVAG
ncbi:multicopper oxidase family protein [Roseomonas sp. HF4]|uniref:multicopper oxidase family protein n=1 Tax=Roseomonas sp. HF4 TaxID=2562313 RepID=UPI0010C0E6AF|nr:multicopper oxidase family protein [Roseomonas sp. HF4]